MKIFKIITNIFLLTIGILLFSSCSDSDDVKRVVNITVNKDQLISGTGGKKIIRFKDNETRQLNIHIMPTDATNKELSFKMEGTSVATVSSAGLLTPLAIGTDTLLIEALDGSGAFIRYGVDIVDHKIKITSIVLPSDAQKVNIGKNGTFALAPKLEIKPADAWDKSMSYTSSDESIVSVDANGVVTGVNFGKAIITIKSKDGSNKEVTSEITVSGIVPKYYELTDMADWIVTASHGLPAEGGKNKPQSIIDGDIGDTNGFLSMIKPGAAMEGISVGADEDVFVVVDMKKEHEVDFFRYYHRHTNKILRFFGVTISGSLDGVAYTKIAENVDIPNAADGGAATNDSGLLEIPSSKYRYYKVSFTDWDRTSSVEVGQVSEIKFGHMVLGN